MKHTIIPSAIAPAIWTKIKSDEKIEKVKASVITPTSKAARVITSADQVIHEKRIELALKNYLEHPDLQHKIRVVFVKHEAPSTSHEAAFFNALGIPVLQAKWKHIKTWLKASYPVVIVDTQHQIVVNWTNKIKNEINAEKELTDEKMIITGLFSSSLSQKKTLLPVDYQIEPAMQMTIKNYLAVNEKIEDKHFYSQLLHCIEQVEYCPGRKSQFRSIWRFTKNCDDI